jgi:hypothetical protein
VASGGSIMDRDLVRPPGRHCLPGAKAPYNRFAKLVGNGNAQHPRRFVDVGVTPFSTLSAGYRRLELA